MSQGILTISLADFEKKLPKVSNSDCKNLLTGIRSFLMENYSKIPIEQTMDLERKQTKILKVLKKRGYLTNKNFIEYQNWHMKNTKGFI